MFFFLISCLSFILLSKPLFKSLPVWKHRMKMLSIHFFLGELSKIFFSWYGKSRTVLSFLEVSIFKPSMNRAIPSRLENVFDKKDISLLDLPDLALESILERLSPEGLCNMAEVCSSLRKECRSDHLWDRHMKQKWGKLIGSATYREWQWHIAFARRQSLFHCRRKQNGLFGYLPNIWKRTKIYCDSGQRNSIPNDSIMNWYLTLESGKFCFPAQVYNRGVQNGQVGFMLSCYDAEVSYDFQTNTFSVRYSGIGRRTTEENVEWNRLRAPAVDTPAYVLHVSDCLGELKPGDHVEIQWRRNAEFPYGWWYGVVGHLESCCGNESVCRCLISDNAPVTRTFVIASALFTILFGIQGRSNKLGFSYQDIFKKLQFWKLIVSVFAFSSTPELLFGIYLLYYFRVFERQMGSNKNSVFILFSVVVSLLLQILALALLKDPSMNILTSGPYGLIFSSFVPFYFDIPVSTRFHVFGLRLSDKTLIYLAGLQLLMSSWKRSILPGICGILAGSLYHMNIFHIRRAKFPDFIASFFSRLSFPSMGSSSSVTPTRNVLGSLSSHAGRQAEGNYPAPVSSPIEPPEDSISTLVSMGFDRNSVRQALIRARNDINAATSILLESR